MSEANKDEVDKCKQISEKALAAGDKDKAVRFLQKAKRMDPGDSSLDDLILRANSFESTGSGPSEAPPPRSSPSGGPSSGGSASGEGMHHRASAAGRADTSGRPAKASLNYTSEQMEEVQRILRTKDYYEVMKVAKDANEETVKKAYKKMALKLHPDKNKAPGAEEAFKKLSKVVQCLTDAEKKQTYDRYGDEDRIPQQQRRAYQQDFMTPEDLFAAFFTGGTPFHVHHGRAYHQRQQQNPDDDGPAAQRAHLAQMLPLLLMVVLMLASNFASSRDGSRFSFQPQGPYKYERQSKLLGVKYYVMEGFDQLYHEPSSLRDFEKQVDMYHVRNLHSECDYQEKVKYKKVLHAQRRGKQEDVQSAKAHPTPACKEIDRIKRKHSNIYRSAMYMGTGY